MTIQIFKQVSDFIAELPLKQQAVVDAVLMDIKKQGLDAPLVSLRQIEGKLWELRISQSRIFYVVIEWNKMIFLHAYKKQSLKAPRHEVKTALQRMKVLCEDFKMKGKK